uniref:Uncharacterized protein n=1 Tax=Candidatus Kentrum sp. LPFa TaxID=2126335 RepID=A0A450WWS2_9GAMM|nr:MAG: hypothetical protein BECKLPF1236A_GA0070988_103042 [Candidatus Kentron sp. LPFa]VFK36011.1 MAG: hypothetical protein BECKLPF1236C_GA0070990_104672 [Candidatus Kentron sp. LPFa]
MTENTLDTTGLGLEIDALRAQRGNIPLQTLKAPHAGPGRHRERKGEAGQMRGRPFPRFVMGLLRSL